MFGNDSWWEIIFTFREFLGFEFTIFYLGLGIIVVGLIVSVSINIYLWWKYIKGRK